MRATLCVDRSRLRARAARFTLCHTSYRNNVGNTVLEKRFTSVSEGKDNVEETSVQEYKTRFLYGMMGPKKSATIVSEKSIRRGPVVD